MANRNINYNSSAQDILSRLMEERLGHTARMPANPDPTAQTDNLNDNIWRSIAQNLINRSGPGQPPHQNHFVQPQSTIQMNDLISRFIYDYTNSMRDYHDNMRRMIYLLEIMNNPTINGPTIPSGHLPTPSVSSPLSSTTMPTSPLSSTPLPTNTTTEELLFSYYFFPIQSATGQAQQQRQRQEQREPLTRDQIAQYTRTYGYTNEMVSHDTSANVCPITLEAFQVGDVICEIIGCNHIFKRPPLMNWFRRDGRCPVCRFELANTVFPSVPSSVPSSSNATYTNPLNPTETPVSPDEIETEAENTVEPGLENSATVQGTIQGTVQGTIQGTVQGTTPFPRSIPSPVEVQMDELLRGLFGMENVMQRVLDASGNEMYEFDIPINTLFPGSFFQNTGDTFDTSSHIPDVD